MIKNHPSLGIPEAFMLRPMGPGYQEGKQLWLDVTAGSSEPNIFKNAARYFGNDNPLQAEQLYRRGEALTPNDPDWERGLGQLFLTQARLAPVASQTAIAQQALNGLERAAELDQSDCKAFHSINPTTVPRCLAMRRDQILPYLVDAAYITESWDKANEYATEASKSSDGSALFKGHSILGELALRKGNIDEAKTQLLAAGKTSGSPVLDSFGPSMHLASELLEHGEKDVVLQYFEECKTFWKFGEVKLNQWADQVKSGVTPDFGFNSGS
jgi:tetratricopeptide (TPR) repeat protein